MPRSAPFDLLDLLRYTPSQDAIDCERIVRAHARTFALASRFLSPSKRRGAFALYAFCRVADDTVDLAHSGAPLPDIAERLAGYARKLDDAMGGEPDGPIFRELAWTVNTFSVPRSALHELLRGVSSDLHGAHYTSWPALEAYCEGVASSVGEMCTYVFGVVGDDAVRARAVRYARTLGAAMQLTNILRDVGEDAKRGRCYLPDEDLVAVGLTAGDILEGRIRSRDPRWQSLMRFEISRARKLYEEAMPGVDLLEPDARRCATACATGYAAILTAIEAIEYDSLTTRARVGTWARARVLFNTWRGHAPVIPEWRSETGADRPPPRTAVSH